MTLQILRGNEIDIRSIHIKYLFFLKAVLDIEHTGKFELEFF